MALRTYDPTAVTVTIDAQLVTGFAPGTFIETGYSANEMRTIVGCGGEVARVLSLDRTGWIDLTLLQTSDSNALLSALVAKDRKGGGLGIFTVQVVDVTGGTQVHGLRAWVERPSPTSVAVQAPSRKWRIAVEELDIADSPLGLPVSWSAMLREAAQYLYQSTTRQLGSAVRGDFPDSGGLA